MKNNNFKLMSATTILTLLALLVGFSLIQSLATPFSFIEEGIYHLQPYDTKGLLKGGIYFGVYIGSLLAIALAIFTQNRIIASLLIIFISLSYGVDLLIQLIGNSAKGISLSVVSLGMIEKSRAGDMLLFKTQIFQALAVVIVFIIIAIILRRLILKRFRVNTLLSVSFFLFMSAMTWGAVFYIYSIVGQSFPAPVKSLAIGAEYYLENKNQKPRVLAENIKPAKTSDYKTIIWVIDESIGGQYLSVNGYNKDTTPYLKKIDKSSPNFVNLGVVPSISNCSGASNLLLRIGLTNHVEGDFKENLKALPTIFQYAKRAGFKTYLIDAQAAEGEMQNNLSASDRLDIDHFETLSRKFVPNTRDNEVLKQLNEILDSTDEELRFVVVVKWGAHWPYPLTYQEEIFKPATRESYTEMVEENRELIFNAYYNSLRFSVDDFLFKLTNKRKLENQIIFYTSDHGQGLFKNNDPLTHCHEESGEKLPMDEYRVPFMIFSKGIKNKFKKPAVNKNSQVQIFASTLKLMGYSQDILKIYGPTLSEGVKLGTRKVNVILTGKKESYRP